MQFLEQIIQIDLENTEAINSLSVIYSLLHRHNDIIQMYAHLIDLDRKEFLKPNDLVRKDGQFANVYEVHESKYKINCKELVIVVDAYFQTDRYSSAHQIMEETVLRIKDTCIIQVEVLVRQDLCKLHLGLYAEGEKLFEMLNENNVEEHFELFHLASDAFMSLRMYLPAIRMMTQLVSNDKVR